MACQLIGVEEGEERGCGKNFYSINARGIYKQWQILSFTRAQAVFQQGATSGAEFRTYRDDLDKANSDFKDAQVTQKKAELDVRKGQEKLIGLQHQLADRLVIAPVNGIVLKVNVKNGDGTKTESNLLTLGDPATEVIKLKLTTLNAAKIRINQAARVVERTKEISRFYEYMLIASIWFGRTCLYSIYKKSVPETTSSHSFSWISCKRSVKTCGGYDSRSRRRSD